VDSSAGSISARLQNERGKEKKEKALVDEVRVRKGVMGKSSDGSGEQRGGGRKRERTS